METRPEPSADRPSLEAVVEVGMLALDSLHPGGLALTEELALACGIRKDAAILDIASGTGESACFLARRFGAHVEGIDHSEPMVRRAETKARASGLDVAFSQADAAHLPFADATFDAAICECTLCFTEKERVLAEMARVVRPGGRVGMHDLCWKPEASDRLKRVVEEIEGERPETLEGWQRLFEGAGLMEVHAADRSDLKARWMQESRRQLGPAGQLALAWNVARRWGIRGLWTVLRSQRAFSSRSLGYALVVGTRP